MKNARSTSIARSVSIGIVGGSGFAGAELLRLCAAHPRPERRGSATGDTQAGTAVGELSSAPRGHVIQISSSPSTRRRRSEGSTWCLWPASRTPSQTIVPVPDEREARRRPGHRLPAARIPPCTPVSTGGTRRPRNCGSTSSTDCPSPFDAFRSAALVAAAGCYPTAATLALAPLAHAGSIEATGSSSTRPAAFPVGRGKTRLRHRRGLRCVRLLDHRHTAEIEQSLNAQVLFTPHLAPMNRASELHLLRPSHGADFSTADVLDQFGPHVV